MYIHETKIYNRVCALLCAFLCFAGVLAYTSTPVFASGQSVGTIDYDVIGTTAMTIDIYASQAGYYIGDDMSELRVPVYMKYINGSDISAYAWEYLSGISRYSVGINLFGVDTNSPINVNAAYFEGVNTTNLHVIWNTANGLRIYYDNYRIDSAQGQYREVFLGYMVYQFDPPSTGFMYYFPTPSKTSLTPSNNNMRGTAYEYGFVEAMVYSINNATSIEQIFQVLNDIDQNTGYLADILAELQDTHSELYYLIAQVWNTDAAILSVDRDIYTAVLNIFALLNNQFGEQESHAENVIDDVEQNMANLAHDIELTKPSAVADIADDYIQQIDTSYNTAIFGSLFNPVIILMLCVVFALAILSYMLYGGS